MSADQATIMAILVAAIIMFVWGRFRHDIVAMGALLACVLAGLVPASEAFAGFGHPAVITVACVLVLGYGLQISGAVELYAKRLLPAASGPTASILALTSLAALLSGFMNNVGALALLMPIAIRIAARQNLPAGKVLMPLAFGSILGGMTTLIGTPPNLIVSDFRQSTGSGEFGMFDFSPVGVAVALLGVVFVGVIGWRLVPHRKQAASASFDSGLYLSEVRIVEGSKAANCILRDVERMLEQADAQIIGLVRGNLRLSAPNPRRVLLAGDILVVEVEPDSLSLVLSSLGLALEEAVQVSARKGPEERETKADVENSNEEDDQVSDDAEKLSEKRAAQEQLIQEFVVSPTSDLVARSAMDVDLRTRYGINLLAISRQGRQSIRRLRSTRLLAGDVVLMQGNSDALAGFASEFGCLPLAERDIRVPKKGNALKASLTMAAAIALTSLGVFPAAVAFALGSLAYVVLRLIPVRSLYTAIDWPVIILLGAMLPVAEAMGSTGAADYIARLVIEHASGGHAVAALVILLLVTMFLSDVMNNVATAAVMCPIALSTANQFGVNADAFLMAIAIGSACAFLTPIGHQNNTLILGPGGFHFGDFWRLGLALEVIVVAVSVPMLLWVWPL